MQIFSKFGSSFPIIFRGRLAKMFAEHQFFFSIKFFFSTELRLFRQLYGKKKLHCTLFNIRVSSFIPIRILNLGFKRWQSSKIQKKNVHINTLDFWFIKPKFRGKKTFCFANNLIMALIVSYSIIHSTCSVLFVDKVMQE